MLFGRLRVPVERALARDLADEDRSDVFVVGARKGHRRVEMSRQTLVLALPLDEEFEGLDRLDRDELDDD